MSFEFFITSMIVILLPGTGVIYSIAIGLRSGFLLSIAAAFGCSLGILPAAAASIIGLAALLHTSALAFMIIKYMGVAYLFYMAWNITREGGVLDIRSTHSVNTVWRVVLDGFLLNVLNPKLSLFFLAFLPQFMPAEASATDLSLHAAVFIALTFLVFVGYGAFASLVRDHIISKPKVLAWVRRSFGGAFALLGAKLAFSE